MGEFDGMKITKEKWGRREESLKNEEEQQQDEREQLHTLQQKQQHKNTYPKKNKKQDMMQIPLAQLCHTTLNHDTNIAASSTSNIHNIQLDETPP